MALANCRVSAERRPPAEAVRQVDLAVRNLDRSINFYARLFDFEVVLDARQGRRPYVIMASPGQACLALHEDLNVDWKSENEGTVRLPGYWSISVGDLDRMRASLWDQGVSLAAGSSEPVPAPVDRRRRSVRVIDPDGHRVELVEARPCHSGAP